MYTNIFDSIRTNGRELLNIESMLYTSILSGVHPTFSLNQAVDNTALLALCGEHDDVINLIDGNVIRIATYKNFFDERGKVIDPILGYMLDALTFPNDSSDKEPFIFSSLPFLYTCYDKNALRLIYSRMKEVLIGNIRYFSSNIKIGKSLPDMDWDHIEQLDSYLRTVQKIMSASRGQYLAPTGINPINNNLSTRISYYAHQLQHGTLYQSGTSTERFDEEFLYGILELNNYLTKNKENNKLTDSRSNLYGIIRGFGCADRNTQELKELVDLCYNEAVAASLCDNEQDLIAVKDSHSNIQVLIRHDDPHCMASGQKLLLIEHASVNASELSWEKVTSILKEAKAYRLSSAKWMQEIENILWRHEVNSLKSAGKYYLSGCFKIAKSAVSLLSSVKDVISSNAFEPLSVITDLRENKTDAKGLFAQGKSAWRDRQDYETMQELLTQTTYIRKGYHKEE